MVSAESANVSFFCVLGKKETAEGRAGGRGTTATFLSFLRFRRVDGGGSVVYGSPVPACLPGSGLESGLARLGARRRQILGAPSKDSSGNASELPVGGSVRKKRQQAGGRVGGRAGRLFQRLRLLRGVN